MTDERDSILKLLCDIPAKLEVHGKRFDELKERMAETRSSGHSFAMNPEVSLEPVLQEVAAQRRQLEKDSEKA